MAVLVFEAVRKKARLVTILLENRTDRVVGGYVRPVDHRGFDELLVDAAPIRKFRQVALGLLKAVQKSRFQILTENLSRKLQRARGIFDHLHALEARDFIEKPAATGVH